MDKPRLIKVEFPEVEELLALRRDGNLSAPYLHALKADGQYGWWADADELRAWRATFTSPDVE
jgi:hypothetical protein